MIEFKTMSEAEYSKFSEYSVAEYANDLMKRDSEIKILIGCTEAEKAVIYQTHNETQYMKGILIRR